MTTAVMSLCLSNKGLQTDGHLRRPRLKPQPLGERDIGPEPHMPCRTVWQALVRTRRGTSLTSKPRSRFATQPRALGGTARSPGASPLPTRIRLRIRYSFRAPERWPRDQRPRAAGTWPGRDRQVTCVAPRTRRAPPRHHDAPGHPTVLDPSAAC